MKAVMMICLLLLSGRLLAGEIVVITHPEFHHPLTKSDLVNVYMGRTQTLANGEKIFPIDQKSGSKTREKFYRWLVNKSTNEIRAYWSRLVFSGRAKPPTELKGAQAVISTVKNNPRTIGYIDKKFVTKEVKILEPAE
jgi:ABC-type phosphate transport system substrate-binding protein